MRTLRWLLAAACLFASSSFAEAPGRDELALRFPLADLPFNAIGGFALPSMQQSMLWTSGLSELGHEGASHLLEPVHPFWGVPLGMAGAAALDLLVFYRASVWTHEEWHRAVMSRRGISSFNDVYLFSRRPSGITAVSHVTDEDLVRLKRDYPAEHVRLSAAGMESELELALQHKKNAFFAGRSSLPHLPSAWFDTLAVVLYRNRCSGPQADVVTDMMNQEDGDNIPLRDFTGLDCTAWTYDLHRPDEPYEARGVHPSGVGIDRYIHYSDLSEPERSLMRSARNLSLLNLVSPYLFGFSRFTAPSPLNGRPFHWNVSLMHHLTSYGHELSLDLFLAQEDWRWFFAYRHGLNQRGHFPGIEIELWRRPFELQGQPLHVSGTAMLWVQPRGQSYLTSDAIVGGLLRGRLDVPMSRHLGVYFEAEGKTEGWVPGVVDLGPAVAFRSGVLVAL